MASCCCVIGASDGIRGALGLLQGCAGRMERAGARKRGCAGKVGQAFLPVLNRRLGRDGVDSSRPRAVCFAACGGTVVEERVCVANCPS